MKLIIYILLFVSCLGFSQNDSIKIEQKTEKQLQLKPIEYKPLSPAKAAFYSAILPGAGQIYNNRYWWQLPLIYGGLGTSIYFYIDNDNEYGRFRTAFKRRKAGLPDEFNGKNGNPLISDAGLERAQKQIRKNRDISLLFTVLTYILQIVEASVTAHLLQFDDSNKLSIQPTSIPNFTFEENPTVGLSLKYSF